MTTASPRLCYGFLLETHPSKIPRTFSVHALGAMSVGRLIREPPKLTLAQQHPQPLINVAKKHVFLPAVAVSNYLPIISWETPNIIVASKVLFPVIFDRKPVMYDRRSRDANSTKNSHAPCYLSCIHHKDHLLGANKRVSRRALSQVHTQMAFSLIVSQLRSHEIGSNWSCQRI